ncbi:HAMP domain-containing sensor histidine kinase [Fodinibacter luteus]|uniref:histidine kinase n=1 Tax=Fodinibacter luteus TaxID=552064 RepID=A0ABP8KPT0_9MICO
MTYRDNGPVRATASGGVPGTASDPALGGVAADAARPASAPRTDSAPRAGRPWRPRDSARARLLLVQVGLVVLALLVTLVITRQYLLERVDDRIDAALAQEVGEFRALAAKGIDPVTGALYDDPERLLTLHLQRTVPQENETILALVDGVPAGRLAPEPPVRLDLDPEAVATFASAQDVRTGELETASGVVRYRVVPVLVEGSPRRGALVVGVFRDLERREVDVVVLVLLGAGLVGLLLAGSLAWVAAGRVLRPVDDVRRAAEEIGASDLSRRLEVRGTDEVADLARTFNGMLDRLEHAFADQRQFLDDASHELRTPITIVRGNLETMSADPAQRAASMTVVLDELDRMGRLVDDLLTLARSDGPDFVVPGRVELSELTLGVLARARALADRDWQLDEVGAGFFLADEQRVLQAMLQLAENAVAHTGPGDVIRIGSAAGPDSVDLWVHDSGPGISPEQRDRVLERFVRAGTSRSDGAGLGLAIVSTIARAHDGEVVIDEPDAGARVRLHLPVRG